MGGLLSRQREPPSLTDEVIKRIRLLEQKADLNNDGVVTKEEFTQYTAMQSLDKDRKIQQLRERLAETEKQYEQVQRKHEALLHHLEQEDKSELASNTTISTKAIDAFVDELLDDPKINIYWLHDSIERPLYRNPFFLFFKSVWGI